MRTLEVLEINGLYGYYIGESLQSADLPHFEAPGTDPAWDSLVDALAGKPVVLTKVQDWTGKLTEFPADKRSLPALADAPYIAGLSGIPEDENPEEKALTLEDVLDLPQMEAPQPLVPAVGLSADPELINGTALPETGHGEGSPESAGSLSQVSLDFKTEDDDNQEEPLLDGGGN